MTVLFDRETKRDKMQEFYKNVWMQTTRVKEANFPSKQDSKNIDCRPPITSESQGPLDPKCLDINVRYCRREGHPLGRLRVVDAAGKEMDLDHNYSKFSTKG